MKTVEIKVTRSVDSNEVDTYVEAGYAVAIGKDGQPKLGTSGKTMIDLGKASITKYESIDEAVQSLGDDRILSIINTASAVQGKDEHATEVKKALGLVVAKSRGNGNAGQRDTWRLLTGQTDVADEDTDFTGSVTIGSNDVTWDMYKAGRLS